MTTVVYFTNYVSVNAKCEHYGAKRPLGISITLCLHCPVSNNGFLPVRFWFSLVWSLNLLLRPFHKKQRIWEKSFGFCQTDNLQCSFIVYCYTYRQLTCRNLEVSEFTFLRKSTKRKPWLSALTIFDNNSCLLELKKD